MLRTFIHRYPGAYHNVRLRSDPRNVLGQRKVPDLQPYRTVRRNRDGCGGSGSRQIFDGFYERRETRDVRGFNIVRLFVFSLADSVFHKRRTALLTEIGIKTTVRFVRADNVHANGNFAH